MSASSAHSTPSDPQSRPTLARSGEDPESLKVPKRAHTFQSGTNTERTSSLNATTAPLPVADPPDTFEAADNDDPEDAVRQSVDMGELPIELVSLTDAFIESLSAKVHPTPPNIDTLSRLFQDFYDVASTHIDTHISALATRQMRETTPAAAARTPLGKSPRGKAKSLGAKDKASSSERAETEHQMLTPQELTDRRRARKALEHKRARLEEAVERRLCEGIYSRIYRHRSTQDEAQDAKLRSKTTALALVGINLADLGVDLGEASSTLRTEEIKQALEPARKEFALMNEKRYPLGKLNHLKGVHRSIVDVLSQYLPSASADEIMPMMIFTLITLPPEGLHAISDAHFIQNFRGEQKLNGEAAYCLTTLEAAISFLQTVDLSTLRADELPSGPPRLPSQPNTPRAETFPPAYAPDLASGTQNVPEAQAAAGAKPVASPAGLRPATVNRNRRLSELVATPALAINAASDSLLTTADQSLKNISNSLGDSYNFLVGKLRERQAAPESGELLVPKTLDDARKLVSTPPPDDDGGSVSGASETPIPEDEAPRRSTPEDRILAFIGGQKIAPRDRSVDGSSRSASRASSKRVVSGVSTSEERKEKEKEKGSAAAASAGSANPLESMRNLGSSLNPMARLSGISMMRGFGRTASGTATKETPKVPSSDGGDLATAFPDIAKALPPKELPKIAPPNKRFMEMQNPGDLRLGEVLDLLRDYRRLANALKGMDAFETK
ncbi:related to VPS9 [Cephalotrichum gorgonifer]|uniref:Related to VPS9 n=1 Tax=Cephalotrichum gorgonifer TaxID=2041049 RepID=A0AAE8N2W8_9PEZI|nr:related to VPS9 [Cephalotrichum gorgonifer]